MIELYVHVQSAPKEDNIFFLYIGEIARGFDLIGQKAHNITGHFRKRMLHQSRIGLSPCTHDSKTSLGIRCAPDAGLLPPMRSLDQPLSPKRFEDSSRGDGKSNKCSIKRENHHIIHTYVHVRRGEKREGNGGCISRCW